MVVCRQLECIKKVDTSQLQLPFCSSMTKMKTKTVATITFRNCD